MVLWQRPAVLWGGWALVLIFLLHTHEAGAGEVVELNDGFGEVQWEGQKAKLEEAIEHKMSSALTQGSADAVSKLLVARHDLKLAKQAHQKSVAKAKMKAENDEDASEQQLTAGDPAAMDKLKAKLTQVDKLENKLNELSKTFETADTGEIAVAIQDKMSLIRGQLKSIARQKQLAFAREQMVKAKAKNMHSDFKFNQKPMSDELQKINTDMTEKIDRIKETGRARREEKQRAVMVAQKKAQLEMKLKIDERTAAQKEREEKEFEQKLSRVEAEEGAFRAQQQGATAAMATDNANLVQGEHRVSRAQGVVQVAQTHVKMMEREVQEGLIVNDTNKVRQYQDALAPGRHNLENAQTVLRKAVAAVKTEKSALLVQQQLAVAHDDYSTEKFQYQVTLAREAEERARANETAAEQLLQAAIDTRTEDMAAVMQAKHAAFPNPLRVEVIKDRFILQRRKVYDIQNQVTEKQDVLNNTIHLEAKATEKLALAGANKGVDSEINLDKLESYKLKQEIRKVKEAEAIAEDLEKKDQFAKDYFAKRTDAKAAKAVVEAPVAKVQLQEKAVQKALAVKKEQAKKKVAEEKYYAAVERDRLDGVESQVRDIMITAEKITALRANNTASSNKMDGFLKEMSSLKAKWMVAFVPEEKAIYKEDQKHLQKRINALTATMDNEHAKQLVLERHLDTSIQVAKATMALSAKAAVGLNRDAGRSVTLKAYAFARREARGITNQIAELNLKITAADKEKDRIDKQKQINAQALVKRALKGESTDAVKSQANSQATNELLARTQRDLVSVNAPDEAPAPPAEDDAEVAPAESVVVKVQELVDQKAQEKENALHKSEMQKEEKAGQDLGKESVAKATLDDLLSQLMQASHAVATANQQGERFKGKLEHAQNDADKREIGEAMKVQREKAAESHAHVEGLISKVARAKVVLRGLGVAAAQDAKKDGAKVKEEEKQAKVAAIKAKEISTQASKQAKIKDKAAGGQLKMAKAARDEFAQQAKSVKKEIQDLENEVTGSADVSTIKAQVSAKQEQLDELLEKEDTAAANVATKEEVKATADNKAVEALAASTDEAKLEKKNAINDASVTEHMAADAKVQLETEEKKVQAVKTALDRASSPAKAAEVSKQLAQAEQTASNLEAKSNARSQAAKIAVFTEHEAEATVQKDEDKVATVQNPYEKKADAARRSATQGEYRTHLSSALRKSGLHFIGQSSWLKQQAETLTNADSTAAKDKAMHNAGTAAAVSHATGKLQDQITSLRDANTMLEKRIQVKVGLDQAKAKANSEAVQSAFDKLGKSAEQTNVDKPESTSLSLEAVVNEAVKEGGKTGIVGSLLDSLDESESAELGDSMSQSESKPATKQLMNEVYDQLGDPTALLQMSRWSWKGTIPDDGVPSAPKTPFSASGAELYKQAVDKTESLATGNVEPVKEITKATARDAKDAKASIAEAKMKFEEDTKALNEAKDKTGAALLAKKIESSKTLLANAEKKEQQAQDEEVENKIQPTKIQSVSSVTTILGKDAMDNAVALKESVQTKLTEDTNTVDSLKGSLKQATSTSQVDSLSSKIQLKEADAQRDKVEIVQATENVAQAGTPEILAAVRSGSVTGDTAVIKSKELEEGKMKQAIADSKERVVTQQTKIQNLKDKIAEAHEVLASIKAKPQDGGNTDCTTIETLESGIRQNQEQLKLAQAQEKTIVTETGDEIRRMEAKNENMAQAFRQAERSVSREEQASAKIATKEATVIAKQSVKVDAEEAAKKVLQQEQEAAHAQSASAPSKLLQNAAKESVAQLKRNEKKVQQELQKDEEKMSKEDQVARDAKTKMLASTVAAVYQVAAARPSPGTQLDRRKAREIETAHQERSKEVDVEDKLQQQQVDLKEEINRREARIGKTEAAITELNTRKKSLEDEINAGEENTTLERKAAVISDQLHKKKTQLEKDKGKLQGSKQKLPAVSSSLEQAERDQQKASREVARAKSSALAAKSNEAAEESISEKQTAGAIKALELDTEANAKSKVHQEEEEAKAEVKQAEIEEQEIEPDTMKQKSVAPDSIKALAHQFLTTAGFGVN